MIGADTAGMVRVSADQLFQMMAVRRPGQLRGEPWLVRSLPTIHSLSQYHHAELERKKTAAMLAGFVRRPVPEGMTAEELGAKWGADVEMVDGVGMVTLEPGTMQYLEPGEEINMSS